MTSRLFQSGKNQLGNFFSAVGGFDSDQFQAVKEPVHMFLKSKRDTVKSIYDLVNTVPKQITPIFHMHISLLQGDELIVNKSYVGQIVLAP